MFSLWYAMWHFNQNSFADNRCLFIVDLLFYYMGCAICDVIAIFHTIACSFLAIQTICQWMVTVNVRCFCFIFKRHQKVFRNFSIPIFLTVAGFCLLFFIFLRSMDLSCYKLVCVINICFIEILRNLSGNGLVVLIGWWRSLIIFR